MRKYLSAILILVLLTSISINIFAEDVQPDVDDNEYVDECAIEDIENILIEDHNCNSCRIPNLTTAAQEQLMFLIPLKLQLPI